MISEFLRQWQELLGAFIGGLMGFIGAHVVASNARKREEQTAARLIMADLLSIRERTLMANEVIRKEYNINPEIFTDEHTKIRFVQIYLDRPPITSPQINSSIATVMMINHKLDVLLSEFRIKYANVDQCLNKIEKRRELYLTDESRQGTDYTRSEIETVYEGLHQISERFNEIAHLLDEYIIESRYKRYIARIRKFLCCCN